jgi:hypothetical protein
MHDSVVIHTATINVNASPPSGYACKDTDTLIFSSGYLLPPPIPQPVPQLVLQPVPAQVPQPVPAPVPQPVPQPVPAPTPAPPCIIDVGLTRVTSTGVNCANFVPPRVGSGDCADGTPINVMVFSYQNGHCSSSENQQGGIARCQDFAPLIAAPVNIRCSSEAQVPLIVTPPTVPPFGTYLVTAPGGGAPPPGIDCEVAGQLSRRC